MFTQIQQFSVIWEKFLTKIETYFEMFLNRKKQLLVQILWLDNDKALVKPYLNILREKITL